MSADTSPLPLVARLRDEFDLGFAGDRAPNVERGEGILAIALEGDPYALLLRDLDFLERGVASTFLTTGVPAFLGLAGLRGELLPLWDLATLLGYPLRPGRPAWVACSAESPRWAAAFGCFDGMLRAAPAGDFEDRAGAGPGARFTRGVCKSGGVCRPVLDLRLISQSIREGSKR